MSELKPCPFCGGRTTAKTRYIGYGSLGLGSHDEYRVVCQECRASSDEYRHEAEAIAAWNRRADARQHALKTKVCPMCEDCPDGCPVETPKDSRNIVTNADRIRSMNDEELATEITKNPSIPCRMCEYYNHKLGHCDARRDFACVTAYAEALALDWLQQPVKEE
jgi:Lar family restriction alleviation protein